MEVCCYILREKQESIKKRKKLFYCTPCGLARFKLEETFYRTNYCEAVDQRFSINHDKSQVTHQFAEKNKKKKEEDSLTQWKVARVLIWQSTC